MPKPPLFWPRLRSNRLPSCPASPGRSRCSGRRCSSSPRAVPWISSPAPPLLVARLLSTVRSRPGSAGPFPPLRVAMMRAADCRLPAIDHSVGAVARHLQQRHLVGVPPPRPRPAVVLDRALRQRVAAPSTRTPARPLPYLQPRQPGRVADDGDPDPTVALDRGDLDRWPSPVRITPSSRAVEHLDIRERTAVVPSPRTPVAKPAIRPLRTVTSVAPASMRTPAPAPWPRRVAPPRSSVTPAATTRPSAGQAVRVTGSSRARCERAPRDPRTRRARCPRKSGDGAERERRHDTRSEGLKSLSPQCHHRLRAGHTD